MKCYHVINAAQEICDLKAEHKKKHILSLAI